MSQRLNAFEALALVPGWDPEDTDVEELKGGLSNRNYLIQAAGERCVMRLNAEHGHAISQDRSCELTILGNAAAAGLAPQIVYSDIENGILLTEFLPDNVWSKSDLRSDEKLALLADLLRNVHALPTCGVRLDLNLSAARYEEYLKRRHGLHAFATQCVEVIASIPASRQLVCCHNDIVAENIIGVNSLKLIDWEYAGDNDPFFDLASLIGFHNLDRQKSDVFLDAYTGGINDEHRERLADQLRIFDAIQWLWLASRHLASPRRENVTRLEELQQRIR